MVLLARKMAGQAHLFQNQLANRAHLRRRLGGVLAEVLQHQHEFVAAQAGYGILLAQAGAQALADFHQQPVAHFVAPGVVQCLEVVDVHKQHGRVVPRAGAAGHHLLQAVRQQAPVGQAGEGVIEGQIAGLLLCGLAGGDVDIDTEHLGGLPWHIDACVAGKHIHRRAVFAPQAQLARRNGLARGEHGRDVLAHRLAHFIGNDQIQQVPAQGLLLGVAVERFGCLVPVGGGAIGPVALHRDGGDVAQQRAKAQLGFTQGVLCLGALGDVPGDEDHGGMAMHPRAQRAGAALELAHARKRCHLVLEAAGVALLQRQADQIQEAVGLLLGHHLV